VTDPTSRYHDCAEAVFVAADGNTYRYLRRRFLPPPGQARVLAEHTVRRGDRPDLVSADHLGDAEQFWRVCDANPVLHPDELTADERIGTTVRIPFPLA
jgi:hypothetical protein